MYAPTEREPRPQPLNGLEDVTIRLHTPATAAAIVIASLSEFSRNYGTLRICASQPDANIGIMHAMPSHFAEDYPRPKVGDPEPWDIIVRPTSGFDADAATSALRGHQLTNTRFIFPQEGVALTREGFSTRLDVSETLGRALRAQLPRRSQQLRRTPYGLRGVISNAITNQLNTRIGELPPSTCITKDVALDPPHSPRPPLHMSAVEREIFRQCVHSLR